MRKTLLGALAVGTLLITLGAAGCSSSSCGADLEGKTWALESYGDPSNPTSVIKDTRVTAEFVEGEINGNAGANNYSGSCKTDGTNLTFGPIAATEMYRMDPEGVMDQEYAYLQALDKAVRYEVKDGKLIITGTDGQVLTFAAE